MRAWYLITADPKSYWEKVYRTKRPTEVSWYRPHLDQSLRLIERAVANHDARIVDVGGGESTLVDDLLAHGYRNLHVLDISSTAISVAKERLGADAIRVNWLCGDVTTFAFERHGYDVWHDRAVFHFLTTSAQRHAYVRQVAHAMKPGGHVVMATFGPRGPAKCSGLDVARYDVDTLHDQFGTRFRLVESKTEMHRTPAGATQEFLYCYCRVELDSPGGRGSR
jgi:2-polyprenyl-3-methyl-5-hydroxy-6-metoxy-1,4-benzoquinol methylase